jgi:phage tail sheath protein FI
MPQYLTPGVYVEERPGTPPIAGVGTSTAGFIGVVADDVTMPETPDSTSEAVKRYPLTPAGEARLVTDWGQFKNRFGDLQQGNALLAHAVYGFFLNGGTTCHVVRVPALDDDGLGTALAAFERIDEIALIAAPGGDVPVQKALVGHCEKLKDRFAILDGADVDEIGVESIAGDVGTSAYAALYFPHLCVADPLSTTPDPRLGVPVRPLPPSGHVAGVYARVDAARGVHKAPANEGVRGALALTYDLTEGEQGLLNPRGVNAIRNFNGTILVWGARTLGGDANGEYRYVSVRRLINFLRESIEEGTRFAVFEPNSKPLWQRIRRSVTALLTLVWRDGALLGDTPEQAFYVTCDETTNPPDVREAGQVVTEIGVAVVKPAEFVVFRISQLSGAPA